MVQLGLFLQLPSLGHADSESGVDVGVGVAVMILVVGVGCVSTIMDVGLDSGHMLTPAGMGRSLVLPAVKHLFAFVLGLPFGSRRFE